MAEARPVRILYVEDDEGLGRLLQKKLQRAGFLVDLAATGQEGLQRFSSGSYQMLALDYDMPGLTGLQVIRSLAAQGPLPPTILVTGAGNENVAVEAMKLGIDDYIVKDGDGWYIEIMPSLIRQALARRRLVEEKRQAEEALAAEKERLAVTLRSIGDGVITTDTTARIVSINETAERLTGWKEDDARGRLLGEVFCIINQKTRERCDNPVERVIETGGIVGLANDTVLVAKDKTEHVIADSGAPVRGPSGQVIGVVLVFRDVTDAYHAQAAISESGARLKLALEGADQGLWDWDVPTGRIVADQRSAELFEMSLDEETPHFHRYQSMIHPEDRPRFMAAVQAHLDGNTERFESRFRILTKSGRSKWLMSRAKVVQRDGTGRPLRVTGTILDITGMKQLEEQRDALFTLSEDLFCVTGFDGFIRQTNPAWTKTLGWTEQELVNVPWLDFFHREDRELGVDAVNGLKSDRPPAILESRIRHSDGEYRWFSWRGTASHSDGLIYAVGRDITEQRRSQEILVQTERIKAVGEMAGAVAHNFNNLLQIVVGGAQLALTHLELGGRNEVKDNLEQIIESSRWGAQTVKRLQDFARIRRDDPTKDGKIFDLSRIVREAIEMSKPWWKTGPEKDGIGILLHSTLQDGCFVRGKDNELFEVAVNLIKNAAEALPDGGEIRISTAVEGDRVALAVQDDGIGIREQDLGRLFEPFWTTKGFHGTGMGLSSSLGIVRRHGGEISVKSREGRGTQLTVGLPMAGESAAPRENAGEQPERGGLDILAVDDMQPVLKQLKVGLTRAGHRVHVASSGAEALDVFRSRRVDLVICDLGMPEMNGWQVADAIFRLCETTATTIPPFIMLTGWGGQLDDPDHRMEAGGVTRVIEKPVDIQTLSRIVRELVRDPQGG